MHNPMISQQRGAVLVTGLILLTVMVLIGTTAVNFASISEKITSNMRNKEIALQASESALIDAEQWLVGLPQVPTTTSSCGVPPCDVFALGIYSNLHQQTHAWWLANGTPFSGSLLQVQSQPHYVIEQFNFIPYELDPDARSKGEGYYYYQITARGTGGDNTADSVVQSIYTVQYK